MYQANIQMYFPLAGYGYVLHVGVKKNLVHVIWYYTYTKPQVCKLKDGVAFVYEDALISKKWKVQKFLDHYSDTESAAHESYLQVG